MATPETPFGPTGEAVYKRTYSRQKPDGTFEIWPETVDRVARGNLRLVYGDETTWSKEVNHEYERLTYFMSHMAIMPAGRQLWASGVEGRQFLFNCHVSGWGDKFSDHFAFTFMRLVEGGGVGANYSTRLFEHYGPPTKPLNVHVMCDPEHKDIDKLRPYLTDDLPSRHVYHVVEDTREGWAAALTWLIDISMLTPVDGWEPHTDFVFDVSHIRPEGSPLVSSGGVASGPTPLAKMLLAIGAILNRAYSIGHFTPVDMMEMDHEISVGAIAGGKRRSARMSMCHWADPYIHDFINAKADGSRFWTTNISVEIDNEFIKGLADPEMYPNIAFIHKAVCEAVLKNGEPGYWNSDLSNEGEVGKIIATNPCGEIPLEAWEACNLGHVNLDWFVNKDMGLGFDYKALEEAHKLTTRFLIRSTFGDITDPKQKVIQERNRRIGVGHMGVQGFFAKSYELKYSEIAKPSYMGGVLDPSGLLIRLHRIVRHEADTYAFELRIPSPVKVTTVAPTGSVAKLPGVSEGIHPIYARWFVQRVRFSLRDDREFMQVEEYRQQGFKIETDIYDQSGMTAVVCFPTENLLVSQVRKLGLDVDLVESTEQISVTDMLELQAFYQKYWADNAISYTANVPEGTVTPEALGEILREYLPKLKGTTIMVDASREQAPYTRITRAEYTVADATRVADALDLECSSGACPIR